MRTWTPEGFRAAAQLREQEAEEFMDFWVETGLVRVVEGGDDGLPKLYEFSDRGWRIAGELVAQKPEVEDASTYAEDQRRRQGAS